MPKIRLLTSIVGEGPVAGDAGDVLDVDKATARTWADGERAELVQPERPEKGTRRTTATISRPDTPEG